MQRVPGRFTCRMGSGGAALAFFATRFQNIRGERLYVAYLGPERQLVDLFMCDADEDGQVELPIRDIVKHALALGSDALVLAHNHPSGDPTPSAADIEATRRLAHVGRGVGLTVFDHVVLGGDRWVSFRDCGLL